MYNFLINYESLYGLVKLKDKVGNLHEITKYDIEKALVSPLGMIENKINIYKKVLTLVQLK